MEEGVESNALSAETEIDITSSPSEKDLVWSVDISIRVRKAKASNTTILCPWPPPVTAHTAENVHLRSIFMEIILHSGITWTQIIALCNIFYNVSISFLSTGSMNCLSTSVHLHTHIGDNIHTHACLVITPISQLSVAERVYGSFMGGEAALGSPFGCPYKWLICVCVCVWDTLSDYVAYHWAFLRVKCFSHSHAHLCLTVSMWSCKRAWKLHASVLP